jgi:DNA-binding IclR family transcriptional regulator
MSKAFDIILGLAPADEEKNDRQFVTALARGLEVLRAFRPEDGPLCNQDLAERSGLPKPTVSRITHTLTMLGYLDYDPRLSRYMIAPAVLSLGHACVGAAGIRRAAMPYMQELAEYADASVALGARDRLTMIYLDVARGSRTVAFSMVAGTRVPMHNTAMGAAYLAALPEKDRNFLMDAMAKSLGEAWPATRQQFETAFADIAETGFCIFQGTYERAMNGVGAALVQADGTVNAFSCAATAFQFPASRLRGDIGPRLIGIVRAIAVDMQRQHPRQTLK